MVIETNWYVITGGPCSGKTKTIECLAFLGYKVVPECARIFIDNEMSKGKTIEQIRCDEREFQIKIFEMKIDVENRMPVKQVIFFERGIPDSIAYYRLYGQEVSSVINASQKRRYKGIFLLEQLPFERDSVRTENEELACRISQMLYKAYIELGYGVVKVPVKPIDERVRFILDKIKKVF